MQSLKKTKDRYDNLYGQNYKNANLQDPLLEYDTVFPSWKNCSISELSPHWKFLLLFGEMEVARKTTRDLQRRYCLMRLYVAGI